MVKEIVKQAVKIKMKFKTRNDLISPAEAVYGMGLACFYLEKEEAIRKEALYISDIAQLKGHVIGLSEKKNQEFEDYRIAQLLKMVEECKISGMINKELRELLEQGIYNR